ncbi:magnesium-protoporphyrin IX monomethyl ester anaerobic oxidative cyclase [Eleftheria terrae]|uniref:magnesium-protoporphyrin IX monomethyl ester anaerobic oxidative cyclase n=1 Tax=Eleftheria terrae TaxID=1597781 RepID=UPI00263A4C5E|nr:magnesium-protoporphyrin IX monomethyl ester anaerobic oxidative cyclase [Eleftheria terrae]WKB53227.1 magnesium-protoporphyrin IX monomethyl ester anaerobic oxidative cyclase [Eleftheria terrae]
MPALKILLVNPPHTAIGSRVPREQLPPLGLLSVGGPLIDAGFPVRLLDAELGPLSLGQVVDAVRREHPDVVMLGHSGSSSVHVTVLELAALFKQAMPGCCIVYGGVHPTYHWQEILAEAPQIDIVVRGEGEETATRLMRALSSNTPLSDVPGIAYREQGQVRTTGQAPMLTDLDAWRIGWELIDHSRYSYWGGRRAVVVQFSRGCPYLCSYCGQRGFWTRWRHRDPVRFAKELARLYRDHGVRLINFADELPTGSRKAWKAFLEALIAENVPLTLVGSTRAGDIVRDADILHLYKRAGVIRFLLGIESYSEATLKRIRKGATVSEDQQAIQLLRQHGIISMATYVVGFEEERDADYWHSLRHLLRYDPDQIQLLYVTPHRWTPYYETVADREVVEPDTRRWDYKHQVLATQRVPPWRMILWVKFMEATMQLRPAALRRVLFGKDAEFRHAMRWYTRMGRRVWLREVLEFLFGPRPSPTGQTLRSFAGESLATTEYAMAVRRPVRVPVTVAPGEPMACE